MEIDLLNTRPVIPLIKTTLVETGLAAVISAFCWPRATFTELGDTVYIVRIVIFRQ